MKKSISRPSPVPERKAPVLSDTAPAPTYPGVYVQELALGPQVIAGVATDGTCEFELTEMLFDKDFPGHYIRKIKSVSMTISCAPAPRTKVKVKLTLLRAKVRKKPHTSDALEDSADSNFSSTSPSKISMATSSAHNDSGIFELNFGDKGYLPFEGEGAISQWRLKMPQQQSFDFSTISDIIIRLTYTARDGGPAAKRRPVPARSSW